MDQRHCIADNCEKPQAAKGMCSTHYARWRRTGSMDIQPIKGCSTPGCRRKHHAQGYCHTCYTRQQRSA